MFAELKLVKTKLVDTYSFTNRSRPFGRPKLGISQDQVNSLISFGFTWKKVASLLGVSERTLRYRKQEHDFVKKYSDIEDNLTAGFNLKESFLFPRPPPYDPLPPHIDWGVGIGGGGGGAGVIVDDLFPPVLGKNYFNALFILLEFTSSSVVLVC